MTALWRNNTNTGIERVAFANRSDSCEQFYVHMTVHRNKLFFNETNRRTRFQIYSCTKLLHVHVRVHVRVHVHVLCRIRM